MQESTTFGRRQPPSTAPRRSSAVREPARPAQAEALSAEAEAFRAQLAAEAGASPADFAAWRRSQPLRGVLVWAATLGSFAPGVATFLMDAPLEVSIGLEIAAMVANVWLRRERLRRRREIVAWEDPADAG